MSYRAYTRYDMVDENIQDFMHFETAMFMLGHVRNRIRECMEEGDERI